MVRKSNLVVVCGGREEGREGGMFPYVYKASDEDLSTHSSFCQGGGGRDKTRFAIRKG